jgi:hypothetical protein
VNENETLFAQLLEKSVEFASKLSQKSKKKNIETLLFVCKFSVVSKFELIFSGVRFKNMGIYDL